MTFRVTLGADPGQTGAIAILADGKCDGFIDMPVMARKAGGHEVNAAELAERLRDVVRRHDGAYFIAIVEAVGVMPKQGIVSSGRFMESFGCLKGVLAALRIPYRLVPPQMWKRHLRLTGCDKDAARTMVIQRFPDVVDSMKRKKDVGRADALLLALWGETTEAVAHAA